MSTLGTVDPATEIHDVAIAEKVHRRNSLYDIEADLQEILDQEVEPTDENWEAFTVMLAEQLPKNLNKRQRFGEFLRFLDLHISNRKEEEDRLYEGRKFYERMREKARACLVTVIKAKGRDEKDKWYKLPGHTLTLGLRDNPASVAILDKEQIPPKFKRMTVGMWGDTWAQVLGSLEPELKLRVMQEINETKITTDVSATRIKKAIMEDLEEVPGADIEYTQSVTVR